MPFNVVQFICGLLIFSIVFCYVMLFYICYVILYIYYIIFRPYGTIYTTHLYFKLYPTHNNCVKKFKLIGLYTYTHTYGTYRGEILPTDTYVYNLYSPKLSFFPIYMHMSIYSSPSTITNILFTHFNN